MTLQPISIQFRIPDVYGGLAEARGLLKLTGESLVLDFELKESVLEMLRLDSNIVTIPLSQVVTVEFKTGWFSRWILVSVDNLEALRKLPGANGSELRVKIAKKDAAVARELVSRAALALTTESLKKMLDHPPIVSSVHPFDTEEKPGPIQRTKTSA